MQIRKPLLLNSYSLSISLGNRNMWYHHIRYNYESPQHQSKFKQLPNVHHLWENGNMIGLLERIMKKEKLVKCQ